MNTRGTNSATKAPDSQTQNQRRGIKLRWQNSEMYDKCDKINKMYLCGDVLRLFYGSKSTGSVVLHHRHTCVCVCVCVCVYVHTCIVCAHMNCVCVCDCMWEWRLNRASPCCKSSQKSSASLSLFLSLCLSASLLPCLSISLCLFLSLCLPVYLSAYLFVYLFICLSACLSFHLSPTLSGACCRDVIWREATIVLVHLRRENCCVTVVL
jgi:hypothetical protein